MKLGYVGQACMMAAVASGCALDEGEPAVDLAAAEQAIAATPEVVISGQDTPAVAEVAGDTLYWAILPGFGTEPASILHAPKSGGPITVLQADIPDMGAFQVDRDRVFWPMGATEEGVGGIQSEPRTGGAVTDVVADRRVFFIALDGNQIYFATPDGGGQIQRVAKTGGPITTIASVGPGFDNIPFLVVTADRIVFTQSTFDTECDGRVRWVRKTGGPIVTVASDICNLFAPVVDGNTVYWTETDSATNTGRLMRKRLTSSAAPVVVDTVTGSASFLTQDAFFVYYASSNAGIGEVRRVPKLFGPAVTLASDQQFISWLEVDQTHVWWPTILDGEIKRVPKL